MSTKPRDIVTTGLKLMLAVPAAIVGFVILLALIALILS